jgi:DNA-directed RNA polymerase specialized sigma24 family protein/LysM repeat protein
MFDHDPELSPDLVWLLQSRQVEDGLLARLLVQESYAQLQTFWEAMLDDPQAARLASQETLISALLKANTYHEPQSVRAWLTGLAIDLYRKDRRKLAQGYGSASRKDLQLDQLAPATRLAAVLRFHLNYPHEEVAGFLGEKLPTTKTRLSSARQLLLDQVSQGGRARASRAEGDPLVLAFQRVYPTPVLSEIDLESISQEVIERARRKRRGMQRAAYWKEISLIGAVILVVLLWMTRTHLDTPEATPKPPTKIALIGAPERLTRQPSATPSPQPTGTPYAWAGAASVSLPQTTPTPIPENAFYIVEEGDTLVRIASQLGTSVEALRSLNRLPEGAVLQPGQALLKPGSLTLDPSAPNPALYEVQPSPTPLSGHPSPDEILERWGNFPTNSLWLDIHLTSRGPQGYLGRAQNLRMQIWATLNEQILAAGPDQTAPDIVFKMKFNQRGVIYVARPGIGNPWFVRSSSEVEIHQYDPLLSTIMAVQPYHWGDQLINTVLLGSGAVGDRPAYILRQFDLQGRPLRTIWVDQVSGFPLHIQVHDLHNPQRITTETLVTGLEINPDIPDTLFNPQVPWLGGYAKDSRGAPFAPGEDQSPWVSTSSPRINPPYIPAPADLDLAASALQFQFGANFSIFPDLDPVNLYPAEIFIGGRYLGPTRLPNPFFTLCARSPDGRYMAFAAAGTNIPDIYSGGTTPGSLIRWIDLSDPETEHMPVANLQPFSFVFSPDGKQLAMYAEDIYNRRGIYLLDLHNEDARLLQDVDSATSLVWNPNGRQLAYISRPGGTQTRYSLVVLNVGSGEVVSRQPFPGDPLTQNAQTWLPLKWGVPFPVEMGDLGACAAPPAGK